MQVIRWRREKREGVSTDCLFHSLFNSKKPEVTLKEIKIKKQLDNESKAYFGLSVDFYTFLKPTWVMEMLIIGVSREE